MIRLIGLLGLLAVGFFGVSLLPTTEAERAGLTRPADAPAPALPPAVANALEKPLNAPVTQATAVTSEPSGALGHLPDAVRRLADGPRAQPMRPVIFGEAIPLSPQAAASQTGAAARADDPNSPYRRVKAQRANVRNGPSTDYQVVAQLTQGEEIEVLERDGDWALIRLEGDGVEGWVATSLLER